MNAHLKAVWELTRRRDSSRLGYIQLILVGSHHETSRNYRHGHCI